MSTTSKPAVTPEMVEKARPTIAETERAINRLEKCESMPAKLIIVRHLVELAVQDAVSECILIALGEQIDAEATQEESDAAYNLACQHVAAAMREKYGVKP